MTRARDILICVPAKNYNEYMRNYMLRRYHERRNKAIEFLGGKCIHCGKTEDLELDHIDPKTKSFEIGKLWSVAEVGFWAEVKKCQLLCKAAHADKSIIDSGKKSAKETHGTLSSYRYCKCTECKEAKSKHSREQRRAKSASSSSG